MIELIDKYLSLWTKKYLCRHRWYRHTHVRIYSDWGDPNIPVGHKQVLICQDCGKIKTVET